jgi:hypothetical protein
MIAKEDQMKGKSGKSAGDGVQKGATVRMGKAQPAGACSGEGRLQKGKEYGAKPGSSKGK